MRPRQAVFAQLKPLCPAFGDILMSQIHQNLSEKALVFGEQTSAVLHRNIQSPSVELDEGNTELERLIVNWVEGFLEGVSFPPARPPFVRKQVQTDVRIGAMIGECDQVSAGVNDYDELVPLGAVSDRQLDLTQWEMTGA